MSDLAAYFLDGPHAGESMMIGGSPHVFLFPVPVDMLTIGQYLFNPNEPWTDAHMETDNYERGRDVTLYRYRGRY